ncbi:hypothetical protein BJV78DRAFT_1284559 [Lactifluus subvellereus]|nr:hypothetical protein BJV78DRAFT_1284559 [Lactifluus subvellereus]
MTVQATLKQSHDFLTHPPSPRIRTTEPRPPTPVRTTPRRRSSTVSAISAWAVRVLPGTPAPVSPPTPSFSRRPSIFFSSCSTRRHSASFISFTDTPTADAKLHTPTFLTPGYTCTVVPLPVTPYTSAPGPQSRLLVEKDHDSSSHEMKFPRTTLMRHRKASTPMAASPLPPTSPKKKGLMRFLRPRPRSRSAVHTRHPSPPPPSVRARRPPPPPSPSSPTTVAFRIAHRKRALYTQRGALPLPLDSEVAVMQFIDGGSRADAAARFGGTYTDAAGVVYADEAEAGECLPLLLAAESGAEEDVNNAPPSARSDASGGLAIASAPPSPLSPSTPPVPSSLAQPLAPSPPRGLFSIPARAHPRSGRGADESVYLHAAVPSLPLPSSSGAAVMQFSPPSVVESRRKQRRRPAQLTLSLPVQAVGFEDSFAPGAVVWTPVPAPRAAGREL